MSQASISLSPFSWRMKILVGVGESLWWVKKCGYLCSDSEWLSWTSEHLMAQALYLCCV